MVGRGVFATADIPRGSWLCEYKGEVYPIGDMEGRLREYDVNHEGCYVISTFHPVGGKRKLCFDATRRFNQLGRYVNHALHPNVTLCSPVHVRGKWRIGFLSIKDIHDEIVWDYGIRREKEWGRCRLVDGVVVSDRPNLSLEQRVRISILCTPVLHRRPCLLQISDRHTLEVWVIRSPDSEHDPAPDTEKEGALAPDTGKEGALAPEVEVSISRPPCTRRYAHAPTFCRTFGSLLETRPLEERRVPRPQRSRWRLR